MSSRGAYSRNGHVTTSEYHIGHKVLDAKVLVGNSGSHSLPDYAHSYDSIYIKENYDNTFKELRLYNPQNGKVEFEVAFHPEPKINHGERHLPVLHFHTYDESLNRTNAALLLPDHPLYKKVRKYLEAYGI